MGRRPACRRHVALAGRGIGRPSAGGDRRPLGGADGGRLIAAPRTGDFVALLARLHPAASRVPRLARETPARYIIFDTLAAGAEDLTSQPFVERRRRLQGIVPPCETAVGDGATRLTL